MVKLNFCITSIYFLYICLANTVKGQLLYKYFINNKRKPRHRCSVGNDQRIQSLTVFAHLKWGFRVYTIFDMQTENLTPIAFQFSATKQQIESVLIENEPYFIAKDICDILELSNSRKAIASLDEDEKADVTISYTSSNGTIQNRKVKAINESGFYKLIFKSTKPEAKVFQKWVTSEVLPALRKTGFYGTAKKDNNFIDARTIPYVKVLINDIEVRMVIIDDVEYYSINDYHISINSRTSANQTAKKLNAVEILTNENLSEIFDTKLSIGEKNDRYFVEEIF